MSWSDWNNNERDARIRALSVVVGAIGVVSLISLFVGIHAFHMTDTKHDTDAISISLAATQVVLAVFAIMLGIAALLGFWAIRGAAVAAAKREAREYLDDNAGKLFAEVEKTKQAKTSVSEAPHGLDMEGILKSAVEQKTDNDDGA